MLKLLTLSAGAVLLATGCAMTQPTAGSAGAPAKFSNGALVDAKGMTLYTFDKDSPNSGKSSCHGACAALWPPAMAGASDRPDGAWSIITRDDGSRQWAYKGRPVYTYTPDQKPGDRSGDNFKDVWHIVKE